MVFTLAAAVARGTARASGIPSCWAGTGYPLHHNLLSLGHWQSCGNGSESRVRVRVSFSVRVGVVRVQGIQLDDQ